MTPAYMAKLGLKTQLINIQVQTIDSPIFELFKIVLISFEVNNKLEKPQFFLMTFLIANINVEVISETFFLIFGNTDV